MSIIKWIQYQFTNNGDKMKIISDFLKRFKRNDVVSDVEECRARTKYKFCECTGNIKTELLAEYETYSLPDGCHTGFMINSCNNCGGIIGLPHDNMIMYLKAWDKI